MSSGYYLLHRGWFDNDVFKQRIICERAAWIWLIEHACWQDKKVRVKGKFIIIKRGQLTYSIRYLAKAWGWGPKKVRCFLDVLKKGTAVTTATDTGQLIITLCNYERFQNIELIMAQRGAQDRTQKGHSKGTNKKEGKSLSHLNKDRSEDFEENGSGGRLVSRSALLKASELANKGGFAGGIELGLELEAGFLNYISEEPRDPDAAFLSWVPGQITYHQKGTRQ